MTSAALAPTPEPPRPVLRWHGGKWRLAPWIVRHFAPHRLYTEAFGGAASVLLRKPRSYAEIYNDLDDDVVNLFRVLRSERAPALIAALRATPFARAEFEQAYEISDDPVEEARRLIVRLFMGFGSNGHNRRAPTGFRSNGFRCGTTPAQDWAGLPDALGLVIERLRGVVIEHREAAEVLAQHDSPESLHYVDPPYLPETRSLKNPYDIKYRGGMYAHELTTEDHARLLDALRGLTGMVVLSGYPSPVYDAALPGWTRVERAAHADGARARTEVLWINPRAAARLSAFGSVLAQAHLFEVPA
ncbi:DNA adenine methylase [Methylobacterium nodulans]|uniref:D12 class N6 adenine-specific DNA methyltransferase n=1 Tax=Methylobacterium nodulans (strain LMG 21967 / CNCM I-2342 / ORS 2060) TaxID=460265 RepID=B8IIS1_METNO|nr:DNA adenine methylase [Methylobacterium nodulans]ACL59948.1 D12 class N6 adenine-specific DNA methyltransferase [Methylobacterium nodulans ORS 2060]